MKQVRLKANPQCGVARRQCARLRLFERPPLHPRRYQTRHQKRPGEPLAIAFAVHLLRRRFDTQRFLQERKLHVSGGPPGHLGWYPPLYGLFPSSTGALVRQPVQPLPTLFKRPAQASIWWPFGRTLGRMRRGIKRQGYTSSETIFDEDCVLNIHSTDLVGIQLPVPGDAP